jgi:NAD-dependent dihydropyrimidine dehydrogenase PreA subunit
MRHKYLKNVVTLKLNSEKCIGCGMCTQVCPHGIFKISNRKAEIIDRDFCIECGACMKNCPPGAIEVRPGVGCAYAIIRSMFRRNRKNSGCC